MSFRTLGLRAEILNAVADAGYDVPTPVQSRAIPAILRGNDLLAGAQTGTGKTAAFALPLLHVLSLSRPETHARHGRASARPVRALILAPTRELAAQVAASVETYGKHLPLRTAAVFGGVAPGPQIDALRRGVDILVATPGRLLDHMAQKQVDFSRLEVLVLDEADRMLDMGFIRDIRRILAALPPRRQNLLFSATFPEEIRRLAADLLNTPERIQVAPPNATPDLVSHVVHPVDRRRKRDLLSHLIDTGDWKQVLVFTRTKHGADRLARQLETDGLTALAIHGNKSQGARTRALRDFKRGAIRVLVATDIAARGLDIDQLPHVVNFELPNVPEDYVHRIGRTGRAGSEGTAVSLVSADEFDLLRDIQQLLRRELPQTAVRGFEPGPARAVEPPVKSRAPAARRTAAPAHAAPRGRASSAAPAHAAPRGRASSAAPAHAAPAGRTTPVAPAPTWGRRTRAPRARPSARRGTR